MISKFSRKKNTTQPSDFHTLSGPISSVRKAIELRIFTRGFRNFFVFLYILSCFFFSLPSLQEAGKLFKRGSAVIKNKQKKNLYKKQHKTLFDWDFRIVPELHDMLIYNCNLSEFVFKFFPLLFSPFAGHYNNNEIWKQETKTQTKNTKVDDGSRWRRISRPINRRRHENNKTPG